MCNTKDADNNTDQNLDKSPEKNDNQKDTDSNRDQNLDKTPMNNDNQKVSDKFFKYVLILTVVFAICQVVNCIFATLRQNTICNVLSKSESSTISQTLDTTCYIGFLPIDSNLVNKLDTSLLSKIKCTQNSIDQDNQYIHRDEIKIIENIEKLLHLEFAKLEEERTSLTLWIGIITVVFLIFSFYSLLNSEELVKKGQNDIKEIRGLKKEVRDEVRFLNESYIYYTKRMEDDLERVTEKKDDIIKDFQEKVDDLEYRYIAMFDDYFDKIKDKFEKKRNELETELDALNENINILSEIFKTVEEKFNKNEDNFNKVLLSDTEEASNNKQQSTNSQEFGKDINDSEEKD